MICLVIVRIILSRPHSPLVSMFLLILRWFSVWLVSCGGLCRVAMVTSLDLAPLGDPLTRHLSIPPHHPPPPPPPNPSWGCQHPSDRIQYLHVHWDLFTQIGQDMDMANSLLILWWGNHEKVRHQSHIFPTTMGKYKTFPKLGAEEWCCVYLPEIEAFSPEMPQGTLVANKVLWISGFCQDSRSLLVSCCCQACNLQHNGFDPFLGLLNDKNGRKHWM